MRTEVSEAAEEVQISNAAKSSLLNTQYTTMNLGFVGLEQWSGIAVWLSGKRRKAIVFNVNEDSVADLMCKDVLSALNPAEVLAIVERVMV